MERIDINTRSRTELIDITEKIQAAVTRSRIKDGICFMFVPHTTAGITINENADPCVRKDIINMLDKLVPARANYSHSEGNADSHIKSSLLGSCLHVFIEGGRLCLGTWQGIFFAEGDGPRSRQVWVEIVASSQGLGRTKNARIT